MTSQERMVLNEIERAVKPILENYLFAEDYLVSVVVKPNASCRHLKLELGVDKKTNMYVGRKLCIKKSENA